MCIIFEDLLFLHALYITLSNIPENVDKWERLVKKTRF